MVTLISIAVLKWFDRNDNLKSRRSLRKRLRFLRSWVLLAKRLVARKVHHATSFHPSDQVYFRHRRRCVFPREGVNSGIARPAAEIPRIVGDYATFGSVPQCRPGDHESV